MKRRDALRELMNSPNRRRSRNTRSQHPNGTSPSGPGPSHDGAVPESRCRPRLTRPGHSARRWKAGSRLSISIRRSSIPPSSSTGSRLSAIPASTHSSRGCEAGQQVPILVRPHPDKPGRYQSGLGHRRLRAADALRRQVRAMVRRLTDAELVVAQGKENGERRDLSFIERASFAAHLEERGFERSTIMTALGVDKADLSRLIALARSFRPRLSARSGRHRRQAGRAGRSSPRRSPVERMRKSAQPVPPTHSGPRQRRKFGLVLEALQRTGG